ncbi:MAG: hypothetical protein J1E04_06065 [Alistipes sp.]|nr:hypothetical protein [Alistipes sp.]
MLETLKFYQDFPKEGIKFVDIIPLLQDKKVFAGVVDEMVRLTTAPNIAAPEARGFLFAAPLLTASDKVCNIIPMRKSGKLPYNEGDLMEVRVEKEYGFDSLFYRKSDIAAGEASGDVFEITLLDDVLATGGTAEGIAESFANITVEKDGKSYGVRVKEFIFLVGLKDLGGRERLEKIAPVHVLAEI